MPAARRDPLLERAPLKAAPSTAPQGAMLAIALSELAAPYSGHIPSTGGLERVTLDEARHTHASMMMAPA